MKTWVEDMRENLKALHKPWARSAEVGVAVDDENSVRANTLKLLDARVVCKDWNVFTRTLDVKTTTSDDHHLWVRLNDFLPSRGA